VQTDYPDVFATATECSKGLSLDVFQKPEVAAPVIALPTSLGYGVASGGAAALNAVLSSCALGVIGLGGCLEKQVRLVALPGFEPIDAPLTPRQPSWPTQCIWPLLY
jgi:hypothetical protein